MKRTNYIIAALTVLCFNINQSFARFATPEEAPVEYEFFNRNINVASDGTSEEIIEKQVSILNEEGRDYFGTQRLTYNGDTQKIEILEAKTILNGKEYKVNKNSIEIKPLASDVKGFDQLYQILVSYPQTIIGSKLYLKYKEITLKQPLPKYYYTNFYYGIEGYWKKSQVHLNSALPFNVTVNDSNKILNIKQTKTKTHQQLDISLIKPIYLSLRNESGSSQLEPRFFTYVEVSTAKNLAELAHALAPKYEKVLKQPLPALYETIIEASKKTVSDIDKINIVTSFLAEKIRYMGDWKTIEGGFYPRDLNIIAEDGIGDCKDYATSTAAMLNHLGFKANVALVMRGINYLSNENSLPSTYLFNHAIVKVIDSKGKSLFIDPTNFTSMADGIYADIADRYCLVLDIDKPTYEKIPNVDSKHSRFIAEKIIDISNKKVIRAKGWLRLEGEEALILTGAALSLSKQAIEENILYYLNRDLSPISKKIEIPDLSSRIVQDINIGYFYEIENDSILTNLGDALPLESYWTDQFLNVSKEQKGALMLGAPYTAEKSIIFKNIKAKNLDKLNVKVSNKWFNAERNCTINGDDTKCIIHTELLRRYIPAEELHSKEYLKFKGALKRYFNQSAIILE
jgi:predicted transglutaminase-like cysteine proteinase